jgi:hypothetical protein
MNETMLEALSGRVQLNCHISDARHGGDYHMCSFLMKMREYYRWEKRLPFGARLPREDVGTWLAEREQLWESLEGHDYEPLDIAGQSFDPFAAESINQVLEPLGLVYSAGLGRNAKPHFFLGRLERRQEPGACSVLIADREYARDLGAPPAMTQGCTIYIRRESLRRMLWEKLESWRWNRPDNALGRAFSCYDFEGDLDAALQAMTDEEIDAVLLHEMGECQAGARLGEDWNRVLLEIAGTPAELMARAVRDHLADCLVTLPAMAERAEAASLHFYLGNLTHMRQEIFPALEAAYREWQASGSTEPLKAAARRGREHWTRVAEAILELGARAQPDKARSIAELVAGQHL